MIDLKIIEETISELEAEDTSFQQCERLSWLYTVRDHIKTPEAPAYVNEPQSIEERITEHTEGSEFMEAASGVSYPALMKILDDHMEAMKVVHPKEYESVMSKIRELR